MNLATRLPRLLSNRKLLVPAALLLGFLPATAFAQAFPCNGPGPGLRMVGYSPTMPGTAPFPLCVREGESTEAPPPEAPKSDPLAGYMVAGMEKATRLMSTAVDMAFLMDKPEFRKLSEGFWTNYQAGDENAKPGYRCTAMFANLQGFYTVAGLGGPRDTAVLFLTGSDVPKPAKPEAVKVDIHQSGEPSYTGISAINFVQPDAKKGTILLIIGDLQTAIRDMKDESEISIDLAGKRVIDIATNKGAAAKSALAKCAARTS
jgi:hypothetical protein